MNTRRILLAVALVATVVAALWPREEKNGSPSGVVEAVPAKRSPAGQPPGVTPAKPAAIPAQAAKAAKAAAEGERFARSSGNLFPVQTWAPPPPKPKPYVPPPPPPPAPPPLPFTYLGQWMEEGETVYFLTTKGDRVLTTRQGDVLLNDWRLDQANEDLLVFTYLPLDMPKTIRIAR